MAHKTLIFALGMVAAASPVSAISQNVIQPSGDPTGTAETKYCMQIEAITGSRLEETKCWTREE